MRSRRTALTFVAPEKARQECGDAHLATVGVSASNLDAFYASLEAGLELPEYFGRNLDGLHECLRDFHWIKARKIVVVHEDLPRCLDPRKLGQYLEVMDDAVQFWRNQRDGKHELVAVFPPSCEFEVSRILHAGKLAMGP